MSWNGPKPGGYFPGHPGFEVMRMTEDPASTDAGPNFRRLVKPCHPGTIFVVGTNTVRSARELVVERIFSPEPAGTILSGTRERAR
jgi:hypothetical protein